MKDATAGYSDEEMHAALDVNIPNYANAVVTTDEIIDSIVSLSAARKGSEGATQPHPRADINPPEIVTLPLVRQS